MLWKVSQVCVHGIRLQGGHFSKHFSSCLLAQQLTLGGCPLSRDDLTKPFCDLILGPIPVDDLLVNECLVDHVLNSSNPLKTTVLTHCTAICNTLHGLMQHIARPDAIPLKPFKNNRFLTLHGQMQHVARPDVTRCTARCNTLHGQMQHIARPDATPPNTAKQRV